MVMNLVKKRRGKGREEKENKITGQPWRNLIPFILAHDENFEKSSRKILINIVDITFQQQHNRRSQNQFIHKENPYPYFSAQFIVVVSKHKIFNLS